MSWQVLEGSVGWNGNPCEIIEEFRLGGQNDGLAWEHQTKSPPAEWI